MSGLLYYNNKRTQKPSIKGTGSDRKICCFTGHRPSKFDFKHNENHPDCIRLKSIIEKEIEKAIIKGYDFFVAGGAQGTDTWAAEIVLKFKEAKYPNLKLEIAIPTPEQPNACPSQAKRRYYNILEQADFNTYINEKGYAPYMMIQRNNYMVDKSKLVIALFDGTEGGTKKTYDYALRKNKEIIRINPTNFSVEAIYNQKSLKKGEQESFFNYID